MIDLENKSPNPVTPTNQNYLYSLCYAVMASRIEKDTYTIRCQQVALLFALHYHNLQGKDLTRKQFADLSGLQTVTASKLIDRLVAAGVLTRDKDAFNKKRGRPSGPSRGNPIALRILPNALENYLAHHEQITTRHIPMPYPLPRNLPEA